MTAAAKGDAAAELPLGGLPLRQAFWALIRGPLRQTLEDFWTQEARLPEAARRPTLRVLWSEILRLLQAGQVRVFGHRVGATGEEELGAGVLHTSLPDLQRNSLVTDIGEFLAISVRPAVASSSPEHAPGQPSLGRPTLGKPQIMQEFDRRYPAGTDIPRGSKGAIAQELHDWYQGDEKPKPETIVGWITQHMKSRAASR